MNTTPEIYLGRADPWRQALDDLYTTLGTSANGLQAEEAPDRLAKYGPNQSGEPPHRLLIVGLAKRFSNPLVLILLFAAGVATLTHEHASFLIIIAIVVLSVVIDFVQEHRAENAARALRQRVALRVTAVRGGAAQEIAASDLVPGDIVLLSAGDLVPADCRLIEARDLYVNETLLTGEPYPVEKHADSSGNTGATTPGNGVFMGSSVISGTARAVVVATGRSTRIGAAQRAAADRIQPQHSPLWHAAPAAHRAARLVRAARKPVIRATAPRVVSIRARVGSRTHP